MASQNRAASQKSGIHPMTCRPHYSDEACQGCSEQELVKCRQCGRYVPVQSMDAHDEDCEAGQTGDCEAR
jgi:hypothetical protein